MQHNIKVFSFLTSKPKGNNFSMPLLEEFKETGSWLFRWRSYLPLFALVVLGAGLLTIHWPVPQYRPSLPWHIICLAVSLCGVIIRAHIVGHAPGRTSGRNTRTQVADLINTTGFYSQVRHPLYLGNFVIFLGMAMYPGSWWICFILILMFWLYYERIMFTEEEFLRGKFGDDYLAWASQTPAFIPRFSGWKKPSLPFSMRNALRREYIGFWGMCLSFAIINIIENAIILRTFKLDIFWAIVLCTGVVAYIVIRMLDKKTDILKVEGR
jgi:protein-S-isoprenylcysteine O-methyltransferase Ste14